jgi:flagellar assembly factor FliW
MGIKVQTIMMGEVEVDEKAIITFPNGLPGFGGAKRWFFAGEDEDVIKWMICLDCGHICLPVTSPEVVDPSYSPDVPEENLKRLMLSSLDEGILMVVLNLPRDKPWMGTANLLAPIVINPSLRLGEQVVLMDERYSVRTPLVSEEERAKIEQSIEAPKRQGGEE